MAVDKTSAVPFFSFNNVSNINYRNKICLLHLVNLFMFDVVVIKPGWLFAIRSFDFPNINYSAWFLSPSNLFYGLNTGALKCV